MTTSTTLFTPRSRATVRRVIGGGVAAIAAALTAGCASPPMHYYTLLPSPDAAASASVSTPARFDLALLPLHVPPQVDQAALVVRLDSGQVNVLENEHWASSLGDEIRAAVTAALVGQLGAADVSTVAHDASRPVVRLTLDVQRFDATDGKLAVVTTQWSARYDGKPNGAVASCGVSFSVPIAPGYPSLVAGYQQALVKTATQIARTIRDWDGMRTPVCAAA